MRFLNNFESVGRPVNIRIISVQVKRTRIPRIKRISIRLNWSLRSKSKENPFENLIKTPFVSFVLFAFKKYLTFNYRNLTSNIFNR